MRPHASIALLLPIALCAQVPTARLDTSVLRIGEQATLTLGVNWTDGEPIPEVVWPNLGDTLSSHVEVVRVGPIDTLEGTSDQGGPILSMRLRLSITSFDTGFWAVPPFTILINGSEQATGPLLLEVRPTTLDEGGAPRDIRDIHEAPFDLLLALERFVPWLVGAAAVSMLLLLVRRVLARRRKSVPRTTPTGPTPQLHERILHELNRLGAERLWQRGEHKAYHARLTDLLRGYVEERYHVPARERTTDELLQQLRLGPMTVEQREQLASILRLADLVKFAKACPTPIENDQAMTEAVRFVQATAVLGPTPQSASHAH